nr:hypothetical protein [Porphyromonas gingivalis]
MNQTVQRGAQGAYTGSKVMVGGAQVLLPVMSFDVSKGHSLKGSGFPPVEIRRVPNSRLTHNKKNEQKCLLIVQSSHLDVTSLGTKTNYPYGRGCSKPL